jgi:hypothetical protein
MPVLQRERWTVFDTAALLLAGVDEKQPPKLSLARPPKFASSSRSRISTSRPRSSSSSATAIPAMPPPMMTTSAV